ncbi:hypothetical protein K2Q16_03835 [Patescibacteria group bacterium]|nr:hypothetical protein [Patescibacteria group bacterium]
MSKTKFLFFLPLRYLAIMCAAVALVTSPVTAQTPETFPLPLPLPPTTEPAFVETPVNAPTVPITNIATTSQDLSFTLIPPDPSLAVAPTTPLERGPISLTPPTQARITNLAANVTTRLDVLTQRFEQISERLEARIALEKAAGKDTTAAEAAWADSVATLVNVKLKLSAIDGEVKSMVTSTDSYTAWGKLKISYFDISSQLGRVHQNLIIAVESLK